MFSRDPGPTNQLIAAIELLRASAVGDEPAGVVALRAATRVAMGDVRVVTRPQSVAAWHAAGFDPEIWEGRAEPAAMELLIRNEVIVLLTGTSDIDELGDRALWRGARKLGIESHALLDHPANAAKRFTDADGSVVYPDWLYVPDDVFAHRLTAADVPRHQIRITGELHHARLRRLASRHTADEIARLRRRWGAGPGDEVVLFASECAREMAAAGRPSPYDEMDVLQRLLRQITAGERPGGGSLDPNSALIIVRMHPRDQAGKYDALVAAHPRPPAVIVNNDGTPDLALAAADLIVGMNSSLLYEGLELRRPVVSLTGHDIAAGKSSAG